jgi:hypothetical protein
MFPKKLCLRRGELEFEWTGKIKNVFGAYMLKITEHLEHYTLLYVYINKLNKSELNSSLLNLRKVKKSEENLMDVECTVVVLHQTESSLYRWNFWNTPEQCEILN